MLDVTLTRARTRPLCNFRYFRRFRPGDVGKPKATVAAERVMERVEGVVVTAHTCMIQEKPIDFYKQFHVIVLGLDSLEARRYMNMVACSFLEYDEEGKPQVETIKPLVDGGTEGFKGHARVLLPGVTPCFDCTLWLFPPQTKYPLCTLAETPRSAPHCIEYAKIAMWPAAFPEVDFDGDNPHHVTWVYEKALERAKSYGIDGVTYQLTQGVVKNIIPAIASTNAIIAGMCTLETLKIISMCSTGLDNMLMYVGTDSVYTLASRYEKDEECATCAPAVPMTAAGSDTLEVLVSYLMGKFGIDKASNSFSLSLDTRVLYSSKKGGVFGDTSENLVRTLAELGFVAGAKNAVNVNDKSLMKVAKVSLSLAA